MNEILSKAAINRLKTWNVNQAWAIEIARIVFEEYKQSYELAWWFDTCWDWVIRDIEEWLRVSFEQCPYDEFE